MWRDNSQNLNETQNWNAHLNFDERNFFWRDELNFIYFVYSSVHKKQIGVQLSRYLRFLPIWYSSCSSQVFLLFVPNMYTTETSNAQKKAKHTSMLQKHGYDTRPQVDIHRSFSKRVMVPKKPPSVSVSSLFKISLVYLIDLVHLFNSN